MASLISARTELDHPKTDITGAQGTAKARSSIEIKNSCNCFKTCCPCFFSKDKDPLRERQRRTEQIAKNTLVDSTVLQTARIVRSPGFDELPVPDQTSDKKDDKTNFIPMPVSMEQNVNILMVCDHSSGTSPSSASSYSSDSRD